MRGSRVTEGQVSTRSDLPLWIRLPLGLAVAVTLGVAAALFVFAHPMGDDFCNAVRARELGVPAAVYGEYLQWGGRLAGHVVVYALPALLDVTRAYPIALAAVAALGAFAVRFLIGSVLPLRGESRRAWGLTLVLLALYWAGLPHPGQTVYFFEGASVYSLNLSLALLLVAWLIRLPEGGARPGILVAVLLGGFVVATFHELIGLVLALVLGAGASVARFARDPRGRAWLAALAGATIGVASMVLAPGNEVRRAALGSESVSIVQAFGAAAQMSVRIVDAPTLRQDGLGSLSPLGWLVDAKLLAATVLLATTGWLRQLRPRWLSRRGDLWRVLVPTLSVVAIAAYLVAGGLALGRTLPLRAFNALYLLFLIGWFLTVFVLTSSAPDVGSESVTLRVLRNLSACILALGLLVSSNVKYGMRDLVDGRAASFDRQMERRYAILRGTTGTAEVGPIDPWPSSYFRNDVGDVSPEIRSCVARYFDLDALRPVEGPAAAPERAR